MYGQLCDAQRLSAVTPLFQYIPCRRKGAESRPDLFFSLSGRLRLVFHFFCFCVFCCLPKAKMRLLRIAFRRGTAVKMVFHSTRFLLLPFFFFSGNTAQSPPDGFARNLLADFPSYCPEIPCQTQSLPAEFLNNLPKNPAAHLTALCSVAFISLFYSIFFLFPFRQPAARLAPPWTKRMLFPARSSCRKNRTIIRMLSAHQTIRVRRR